MSKFRLLAAGACAAVLIGAAPAERGSAAADRKLLDGRGDTERHGGGHGWRRSPEHCPDHGDDERRGRRGNPFAGPSPCLQGQAAGCARGRSPRSAGAEIGPKPSAVDARS